MEHIIAGIKDLDMTLAQVMEWLSELEEQFPDQEIIMDGDLYAIVRRDKA